MSTREQLIDDLFAQAAELPLPERQGFLSSRALEVGADNGIVEEVEALLTNYRRADAKEFLQQPLTTHKSAQTLIDGQQFEGYRIERLLAEGGMGEVYLGEDLQLKRRVALKLIKGHATKDIVLRFQSERQILANLKHANIAQLYEAGATSDGLPFFAMEYVEGESIDKFVANRELPLNERLKLFRTVCSAISYAHQNLIIHRDIKPGNILVTENGEPKLLDFGIAKLLHDNGESPDATATMFRALTPQYASPEQVRGEPIATASDVYSLGVLLYELLTGQRPYRLKRGTADEITRAICEQEPTKPSSVVSGQWPASSASGPDEQGKQLTTNGPPANRQSAIGNRQLRGDLDHIILKALRKEPDRRYSSVEQFSEDIRRHLEGLPVTAHKGTFTYRAGKFVRRNKIAVAAAALIVVVLTGGIVATSWQARRARAESARAQQRFNQVRKLAHSLMFDYHDDIAALPGSTQARQRLVKDSLEYLDSLANDAGNDLTLQREIGTAYQRIGEVQGSNVTATRGGSVTFANLGDIDGALASLHKALVVRERLATLQPTNADIQGEWGTTLTRIAEVNLTLGKPTEAAAYYRKAMDIYDKLLAADPKNEVLRFKDGGFPYSMARALGVPADGNFGKANEALVNARKALSNFEALAAEHPTDPRYQQFVGAVHGNIGNIFLGEGRYAEALDEYRPSVVADEILVKANPTNAFYQRELAVVRVGVCRALLGLGRASEALDKCRASVGELEALVAADPSNASISADLGSKYRNLAEVLAATKDQAGAQENIDKSIKTLQDLLARSPSNATARYNLGLSYLKASTFVSDSGDTPKAIENATAAARIGEALVAIDANNAMARTLVALAYAQLGKSNTVLATRAGPADKLNAWLRAKEWYQKGLDIFVELKSKDILNGANANKPDELTKEIAKCDAALTNK
jgi:non-specific serine/threonine protein kinase/serine/threonine-protein kinase